MPVFSLNSLSSIKAVIWTCADIFFVPLLCLSCLQDDCGVTSEGLQPHWVPEAEVGSPWSAYCILFLLKSVLYVSVPEAVPFLFWANFCIRNVILPHKFNSLCLGKVEVSISASLTEPFLGNPIIFHFYLNISLLCSPEKLVSNKWSSMPLFSFLNSDLLCFVIDGWHPWRPG